MSQNHLNTPQKISRAQSSKNRISNEQKQNKFDEDIKTNFQITGNKNKELNMDQQNLLHNYQETKNFPQKKKLDPICFEVEKETKKQEQFSPTQIKNNDKNQQMNGFQYYLSEKKKENKDQIFKINQNPMFMSSPQILSNEQQINNKQFTQTPTFKRKKFYSAMKKITQAVFFSQNQTNQMSNNQEHLDITSLNKQQMNKDEIHTLPSHSLLKEHQLNSQQQLFTHSTMEDSSFQLSNINKEAIQTQSSQILLKKSQSNSQELEQILRLQEYKESLKIENNQILSFENLQQGEQFSDILKMEENNQQIFNINEDGIQIFQLQSNSKELTKIQSLKENNECIKTDDVPIYNELKQELSNNSELNQSHTFEENEYQIIRKNKETIQNLQLQTKSQENQPNGEQLQVDKEKIFNIEEDGNLMNSSNDPKLKNEILMIQTSSLQDNKDQIIKIDETTNFSLSPQRQEGPQEDIKQTNNQDKPQIYPPDEKNEDKSSNKEDKNRLTLCGDKDLNIKDTNDQGLSLKENPTEKIKSVNEDSQIFHHPNMKTEIMKENKDVLENLRKGQDLQKKYLRPNLVKNEKRNQMKTMKETPQKQITQTQEGLNQGEKRNILEDFNQAINDYDKNRIIRLKEMNQNLEKDLDMQQTNFEIEISSWKKKIRNNLKNYLRLKRRRENKI